MFHIDLTIEYKSVLNSFRELARLQQTNLKQLNVENTFIIIWNNFEQIKTIKHQRIDNKDEFFLIITAQILELMWMSSWDLRQDMFDQIAKLNWLFIVKHENLNSKSSLFKSVNTMSTFSIYFVLIRFKYSIILFLMLCELLYQMHLRVKSIDLSTWTSKTSLTFWYLFHA